ncbi:hypothetical protein HID58_038283 [Brassica napus]|uniref:Uncharacterized protein n=1 Tax=Brassica napus TaxID=3708 RepID=A0ABQ8BQK1_BRANA|nr:hypothetical protein HID58_038283 [Brassica napus]
MVGLPFRHRTFVFGGRPAFGFDDAPATPVLSSAFGTASHGRESGFSLEIMALYKVALSPPVLVIIAGYL